MSDSLHPVLGQFFLNDPEGHVDVLLQNLATRQLSAGEVLFYAGDSADCVYLLLEGRVAVQRTIGIGDRTQVIALLDAGTVVGEAGIVAGRFRTTTVSAVMDSKLAVLSQQGLTELEQKLPSVYISMLKRIVSITSLRLQKSSERLALVL